MKIQKQNAITLTLLIITIVILLMLVGITISIFTGENGLIARTKQAKQADVAGSEDVSFSYDIKDITEQDGKLIYNVLIKISSFEKINRVEYGEQILESSTGKEEIAIDFEAEKGVEYNFAITTLADTKVNKILVIDKEILTGIELNKTNIELEAGAEEILQVKMIPDNAFYDKIEWTTNDDTIVTVDGNGKVLANDTKEGTATITVSVTALDKQYKAECTVTVKKNVYGYMIEIYGIQSGNCAVINELELYNNDGGQLASPLLTNLEVYDDGNAGVPFAWRGWYGGDGVWAWSKMFDGNKSYGESYSTLFIYGNGHGDWARLFIYDLEEEVNTIKIYSGALSGTGRHPKQLSVYSIKGLKSKIINENLKTRENDDKMTLWGTQDVSSGVAENIFVKP